MIMLGLIFYFGVALLLRAVPTYGQPYTCPVIGSKTVCYYGTHMKSYDGSLMEAYLGIPYAERPQGELQFKDPKKWTPTEDVHYRVNCKTDPPGCLYKDFRNPALGYFYGVEDCLHLSVFAPQDKGDLRPVLVELVDIDFERGSSSTQIYGPEFIVRMTDSILVTVNSRLGIFGYLVHTFSDNTTIHGNMGLKDQQMALQWVYDNIKYFGGDPNKITLAGGASVSYHLVNEKSSKMIARTIIRHANFITPYNRPWEYDTTFAPINLKNYAHLIDELFKSSADIIGQNADVILSKIPSKPKDTDCLTYPYYRFRPVVDANNGAKRPFLIDHPISIWSSHKVEYDNDIWFWQSGSPAFDWWVPILRIGDDPCEVVVESLKRRQWHITESNFFTDYINQTNFNIKIHQHYFKEPGLTNENIFNIRLKQFIEKEFFPLNGLWGWGQFTVPMLKMIELRPSGQYDRSYNRNFITMYENNSKYRCFQTVYYSAHLCSDKPPYLTQGSRWQVRGDELLFLYTMPWYFESPSEHFVKIFEDFGKRYKDYLYNGFSHRDTTSNDIPTSCHIPTSPLGNVNLATCFAQHLKSEDEHNEVRYELFAGSNSKLAELQEEFNMWDIQLFEILEYQDKVRTPGSRRTFVKV